MKPQDTFLWESCVIVRRWICFSASLEVPGRVERINTNILEHGVCTNRFGAKLRKRITQNKLASIKQQERERQVFIRFGHFTQTKLLLLHHRQHSYLLENRNDQTKHLIYINLMMGLKTAKAIYWDGNLECRTVAQRPLEGRIGSWKFFRQRTFEQIKHEMNPTGTCRTNCPYIGLLIERSKNFIQRYIPANILFAQPHLGPMKINHVIHHIKAFALQKMQNKKAQCRRHEMRFDSTELDKILNQETRSTKSKKTNIYLVWAKG